MIFFDLDGTLFRTHEVYLPILRSLADKYNISVTGDDVNYWMYTTTASLLTRVAPNMPEQERNEFLQECRDRESEAIMKYGQLFDGARELLAELYAGGIPLAIIGMGSRKYVETVLAHCGITHFFKTVLARIDGKTKSEILTGYLSCKNLKPSDCLLIGDSNVDYTAAFDNGVPFIGVRYGYGAKDIKDKSVTVGTVEELRSEIYRTRIFAKIEAGIAYLKRPVVIGINGVDTSGKTYFADGLKQFLEMRGVHVQMLHIDDFHNPRDVRNQDTSPRGYLDHAFDLAKIASLLKEIKSTPVKKSIAVLDLDSDAMNGELNINVDMETVIILEGTMLYRPPVDDLIDYRILLDVGFDEVLNRARIRDVPKYGESFLTRYTDRYIPAQKQYFSEYNPHEKCDIVVDNRDYNRPVCV